MVTKHLPLIYPRITIILYARGGDCIFLTPPMRRLVNALTSTRNPDPWPLTLRALVKPDFNFRFAKARERSAYQRACWQPFCIKQKKGNFLVLGGKKFKKLQDTVIKTRCFLGKFFFFIKYRWKNTIPLTLYKTIRVSTTIEVLTWF